MFLNRERAIPSAQVPSVSREETDSEVASSNRNSLGSAEQRPFIILDKRAKTFPKFSKNGRSMFVKFKSPGEEEESTFYLKEYITALTNCLVDELAERDLVGLR